MTEFYTAEEAMRVLRKTKTMFYTAVNAGEIPFEIDPGRKRGKRFPKTAIDVLAKLSSDERALSFAKEPLSLAHAILLMKPLPPEVVYDTVVVYRCLLQQKENRR